MATSRPGARASVAASFPQFGTAIVFQLDQVFFRSCRLRLNASCDLAEGASDEAGRNKRERLREHVTIVTFPNPSSKRLPYPPVLDATRGMIYYIYCTVCRNLNELLCQVLVFGQLRSFAYNNLDSQLDLHNCQRARFLNGCPVLSTAHLSVYSVQTVVEIAINVPHIISCHILLCTCSQSASDPNLPSSLPSNSTAVRYTHRFRFSLCPDHVVMLRYPFAAWRTGPHVRTYRVMLVSSNYRVRRGEIPLRFSP